MVIRDSEAHLNGQSIVKTTYSIFEDTAQSDPRQSKSKEETLHMERIDDPDYYGFITSEKPGSDFIYTEDGLKHLSADELEQLIEQIKA